ncbi:hypothetical protein [Rhodopila sp.]|uniref:hypothetical protein n=1 Tax=Rhodopila sp. TaxID=2480087 RepID=UPI003D0CD81C
MTKGLLFMALDFATAHEDEFHDWYDREHIPERMGVPGFLNAERWIDEQTPTIHVATYDLESPAVLSSPAYRAVAGANQSVWTRRVTDLCKRVMRYEGEQLLPGDGVAVDGANALLVASMNIDADAEAEAEFTEWYNTEHLPALGAVPGVLAARRFSATDTGSERRFLALYHLRDAAVSRSDAWAKAADTEWTQRMRPRFRDLLMLRMNRYIRNA